MAVYRRTRPRFVLTLLVLSALTLITVDGRSRAGLIDGVRQRTHDAFAPVARAIDRAVSPVGDWAGGVFHSGSLRRKNARLERQLRELRNDLQQRADVVRQNGELKGLLALSEPLDPHPISAHVFAGPAGNFDTTVEIDEGRTSGVQPGMPVVSADGLVGRIVQAAAHSATVLLITDAKSSVGIRFVTSGETAVAEGGGHDLPVDLVDPKATITVGELAVTAGLERARFPAGLPVGVVTKVANPSGALQQTVRLRPVANLGRLDVVRVLHYQPPGG